MPSRVRTYRGRPMTNPLVTPESVEAARIALEQTTHRAGQRYYDAAAPNALDAALPHLLDAIREGLLSDEAIEALLARFTSHQAGWMNDMNRYKAREAMKAALSTLTEEDG